MTASRLGLMPRGEGKNISSILAAKISKGEWLLRPSKYKQMYYG